MRRAFDLVARIRGKSSDGAGTLDAMAAGDIGGTAVSPFFAAVIACSYMGCVFLVFGLVPRLRKGH